MAKAEKAEKVVEITLRVDAQFVRLLNANVGLSGGVMPDRPLDPPHLLARVVLAEARGAYEHETAAIIPPEWRGNIDIVPERRRVYVGGWSEVAEQEPGIEECLKELRGLVGPEPQLIVSIRDCGEETVTLRDTSKEYGAQIGMNGDEFDADSPTEMMAQVRSWHAQQSEKGKRE